jgi:6-pyruvoyltetrahydropterin/6-carboxytetrahydropterin synthase
MFSVTKSFKIPIGHRLTKHSGRCSSYHGHNIKIDITVQRNELNNNDMVIDFYDLKKLVGEEVDKWDHTMILNSGDIDSFSIIKGNENQRMIKLALGDPTSENMCFVLFNLLCEKITAIDSKLRLKSVVIWESDESFAKYEV